ncbi:MAG: 3-isopropylmalate dehydratase large subunit [SAR324 cluster bacterium]|nr:3-isopropylmalate dehydratase large subunit [SAR324 cluster bacterium]
MSKTIFEKIWDSHVVDEVDGWTILYIDRHLAHDLASARMSKLEEKGISLRRPDKTLVSLDHLIPTENQTEPPKDKTLRRVLGMARENPAKFGVSHFFDVDDPRNGIAHVVSPEQGYTLPGITLVCGDSHTATHGALGALAFGIGSTEVHHVFATQALLQRKPQSMLVKISGQRQPRVASKDVIMGLIGQITTGGGTGTVIEYTGEAISAMSMEERMTVCNMSIEAGARAGLVAPDETTYAYLKGRPLAPQGAHWDQAVAHWRTLPSDAGASYGKTVEMDVTQLPPQVTWGTNPGMVTGIDGKVPELKEAADENQLEAWERAVSYMDIKPGTRITDLMLQRVFIGSCTNGRIEDLREASRYVKGKQVASSVEAWVVPGSGLVKRQAEQEGLDKVFLEAGFQWREPGCSLCVGMNHDLIKSGDRCASTSNRNFEGRQGKGSRTHLVSPAMAAAAAIAGHFVDVRELEPAS